MEDVSPEEAQTLLQSRGTPTVTAGRILKTTCNL